MRYVRGLVISLVLCAGFSVSAAVPFKILGGNASEIAEHASKRQLAIQFVESVLAENARAEPILVQYRANGINPSVPQQSRRFLDLMRKGEEAFGYGVLGKCAYFGAMASEYWQFRLGRDRVAMDRFRDEMRNGLRWCREQISSPPEPTLTIRASGDLESPPFKGCLLIMDVSTPTRSTAREQDWTCPRAAVPRGQ